MGFYPVELLAKYKDSHRISVLKIQSPGNGKVLDSKFISKRNLILKYLKKRTLLKIVRNSELYIFTEEVSK